MEVALVSTLVALLVLFMLLVPRCLLALYRSKSRNTLDEDLFVAARS